jgi:hypothetical protein
VGVEIRLAYGSLKQPQIVSCISYTQRESVRRLFFHTLDSRSTTTKGVFVQLKQVEAQENTLVRWSISFEQYGSRERHQWNEVASFFCHKTLLDQVIAWYLH